MPKMKTSRSARKRFRVTASGKIKREKANANHKFTSKSADRKRRLRHEGQVAAVDKGRVKRLLGA